MGDSRSINYEKIQIQESDLQEKWFSFDKSEWNSRETLNCFLTHTSPKTLSLIHENLHLSPKYGGFMRSTGPRYCPSIEDKITRFYDKINHQIFLEPEARRINFRWSSMWNYRIRRGLCSGDFIRNKCLAFF